MSHESRFRENDPARDLPPLGHHEKEHLAIGAIAAEPHPARLPRRRRSGLHAATAAAAAVALALPIMQPWQGDAGPAVLALSGAGTNNLNLLGGREVDSAAPGYLADKTSLGSALKLWGGMRYVADVELSTEGQTGTVFEILTRSDAKQIVKRIADDFGVPEPDYGSDGYSVDSGSATSDSNSSSGEADRPLTDYLWAYVGETGSNFGYYNDAVNPWRDCWSDRTPEQDNKDGICTPPVAENLPNNADAKALALSKLKAWGFDIDHVRFEVYRDEYSVSVSVLQIKAGLDSPVVWQFSFVDDSKISNVYGSLDTLKVLDTYNLISPAAAIERANDLTAKQQKAFEDAQRNNGSGSGSSGEGSESIEPGSPVEEPVPVEPSDPGLSPEPKPTSTIIEPTIEPSDLPTVKPEPVPSFPIQVVHVTRVERGMQWVTSVDGRNLWVPTYEFYGSIEGIDETYAWPLGSVIAVVESQMDLDSFYGGYYGGGVMPMSGVDMDSTVSRRND